MMLGLAGRSVRQPLQAKNAGILNFYFINYNLYYSVDVPYPSAYRFLFVYHLDVLSMNGQKFDWLDIDQL